MENKLSVNSELLNESLFDLEMEFGSISCTALNLKGACTLLNDINEDMQNVQSPYIEGFQIRIQAILSLLNYSNKDLDKAVDKIYENYNIIFENNKNG